MTVSPAVFSPSSILPLPLCQCDLILAQKSAGVLKIPFFKFFFFSFLLFELCSCLKSRKSWSEYAVLCEECSYVHRNWAVALVVVENMKLNLIKQIIFKNQNIHEHVKEGNFALEQAVKTQRGSIAIALLFL